MNQRDVDSLKKEEEEEEIQNHIYRSAWNSHGFTCVPHPDPPSHLPLHPLPLGLPSAPGPSACLMHPTGAGDLFHPR